MPTYAPEQFTPEMIEAVIDSLEDATTRLRAVQAAMKKGDIKELAIKNSREMKNRGLPKISLFAQAAIDALREHHLGD